MVSSVVVVAELVVVVVTVELLDEFEIDDPFDAAFEPLSAVAPELFEPSVELSDWSIATLAVSLAMTEPLSAVFVLFVELSEVEFDVETVEPLFAEPLSAVELFELSEVEVEVEVETLDPLFADPLSAVELFELSDEEVEVETLEPLLAEPLSAVEEFEASVDCVVVEELDELSTIWSPTPDSALDELSALLDDESSPAGTASCAKAGPENARIADAARVVIKVFFTMLFSQSFLLQQRPA